MYLFGVLLILHKILVNDDGHDLAEVSLFVLRAFVPDKDQQLGDSFLHFIVGNLYM
jgi:hypothetical protein